MNHVTNITSFAAEATLLWRTGKAREHAYRPALARLFESFSNVLPVNDPSRSQHGAPDFVFLNRVNTDLTLGYAESKDITIDVSTILETDQITRYKNYANFLLTNGLVWHFFRNGETIAVHEIGAISSEQISFVESSFPHLQAELENFFSGEPEPIKNAGQLAKIMAASARRVRFEVERLIKDTQAELGGSLGAIFSFIRENLVHDLDEQSFADMYSQTLVYGLFAARHADQHLETFSRQEARDLVPETNPFLRVFFDHIAGAGFEKDLAYIVNELCQVLLTTDVRQLLQLSSPGVLSGREDPVVHFYEDFLAEYDPDLKKKLGAFYTPLPVVNFMVDEVDDILKETFGFPLGIADYSIAPEPVKTTSQGKTFNKSIHAVQVLDPAVGTGTFLNQVFLKAMAAFEHQKGALAEYVDTHLIPRIHGFELMMAPYTVAHLKIANSLKNEGLIPHQRLGIFLTNTLADSSHKEPDLLDSLGLGGAISLEGALSSKLKREIPMMVVIGNPPYQGVTSENRTPYASKLIERYKFEPDGKTRLTERKHRLDDDYVKFVAFAESMIESAGKGVLAFIINHGFIDNSSYRGMRASLLRTFDELRVIDLHGNVTKREGAKGRDENIFNIKQGVAILIAIRHPEKNDEGFGVLKFAEVFGTREEKFEFLAAGVEYKTIKPELPLLYFNGKSTSHAGPTVDMLFSKKSNGVQTSRDHFAVDSRLERLKERVDDFVSPALSDDTIRERYFRAKQANGFPAGDTPHWKVSTSRTAMRALPASDLIEKYLYRPFDQRYIAAPSVIAHRDRKKIMNQIGPGRPALIIGREGKAIGNSDWNLVFSTVLPSDLNVFYRGGGAVMPLWLGSGNDLVTNLSEPVVHELLANLDVRYSSEFGSPIGPDEVSPMDVFNYVYGTLHAPQYRRKFAKDLALGFPPLAPPQNLEEFRLIAGWGSELLTIHTEERTVDRIHDASLQFPIAGSNLVTGVSRSDNGRVYLNSEQYFEPVSQEAWDLVVGGFRPLEKFLSDREGESLTFDEVRQYSNIVSRVQRTVEIFKEMSEESLSLAAG